MRRAVAKTGRRCFSVQAQAKKIPCYIGGKSVETAATFESPNPYTNEVYGTVSIADEKLVYEAARVSKEAQKAWGGVPLEERIKILSGVPEQLAAIQGKLIESLILEGGSSGIKAGMEFMAKQNIFTCLEAHVRGVLTDERRVENQFGILGPTPETYVIRKPKGVVGMICPFNFPLMLTGRSCMANLMAGNGFVFKPSMHTTEYGQLMVECYEKAGVPVGLINVVHGGPDTAMSLIDCPDINHIMFTGSSAVGRQVGARAAQHLKTFSLELGGKNPLIALQDADVANLVGNMIPGICMHSGQICIATTKVLVHDSLKEAVTGAMQGAMPTIEYARPDGSGLIGPLINKESVERCKRMVNDAVDKGAEIIFQGEIPSDLSAGTFYPPTILGNVDQSMEIFDEEAFGPIQYIATFKTEKEAIQIANDSKYGLSASVHSTDIEHARKIAAQIESGGVSINGGTLTDNGSAPFGGVKNSGMGRENGKEVFETLTDMSTIYVFPEGRKLG